MTTSVSQFVFSPWLTPARVVATTNVVGTYFNGPNNNGVGATFTVAASSLTIDSVVVKVGDRVLLSNQSAGAQNGVYIVESIGTTVVLQRAFDQQNIEQLHPGENIAIGAGAVNAGDFYTLVEPIPQTIGTDSFVYNGQASVGGVTFSGPPSVANAIPVFADTAGNIKDQTTTATLAFGLTAATGNITATAGNLVAGSSGNAGVVTSFPAGAADGSLSLTAINSSGNFAGVISNASLGQATTWTLPDPGAATAHVLLDTGTGATATITKISTGATPVPLVDAGSCTITAAAGATNTATVTIQLKDGSGTNIARIVPFKVYASSASSGLTLASAASTGFSVASGGLSLANGTAITTQISCMSSATGGCVLSLLDTGRQTSFLVLVVGEGTKISAQLTNGSYG